ncbi:MAG TPA: TOBE domain-containing protein, partial [Polyangiaceae bacterium]
PAWRVSSRGRVSATLRGVVREVSPDGSYLVQIETGAIVVARASARVRARGIDILEGDEVRVEVSAADMTRGRITSTARRTTT